MSKFSSNKLAFPPSNAVCVHICRFNTTFWSLQFITWPNITSEFSTNHNFLNLAKYSINNHFTVCMTDENIDYTDLGLALLYCIALQAYSVSWLLCRLRDADGVFTAFCIQCVLGPKQRKNQLHFLFQLINHLPSPDPYLHSCLLRWLHTHTHKQATFTCFPFVWCIFMHL